MYNLSKFLSILLSLLILSGCGLYKRSDVKDNPVNVNDRVRKNIEEGKGIRFGIGNKKGGVFDFASANELWRASVETLDFVPLVNASYSGGIIITDWYSDNSSPFESIKISIRFTTNEIRSDALDIKVFNRKCSDSLINCKFTETNDVLVAELKREILKKATLYKKQNKDKKE